MAGAKSSLLGLSAGPRGDNRGLFTGDPDSLWQENRRLQGDLERALTERNRLLKRNQERSAGLKRETGSRVLEQRLTEIRAELDALQQKNRALESKGSFLLEQRDDSVRALRVLVARLHEAVELASSDAVDPGALDEVLPESPEALAERANRVMETLWRLLANSDALQNRALNQQISSLNRVLEQSRQENESLQQENARLSALAGGAERDLRQSSDNAALQERRLSAVQERVVELEEECRRLARSNLKLKAQLKGPRVAVNPEVSGGPAVQGTSPQSCEGGSPSTSSVLRPGVAGLLVGVCLSAAAWLVLAPAPQTGNADRLFTPSLAVPEQATRSDPEAEDLHGRTQVSGPARETQGRDRLDVGLYGPRLTRIEGGEFLMGSDRYGRPDIEGPARPMRVAPVFMATHEVSFSQYDAFARATGRALPDDRGWGRGDRPVINVSWADAQAYAGWLSQGTGRYYRLPSEAEWEFAIAGGAGTVYWWGNAFEPGHEVCFNCGTQWDGRRTAPVGSLPPNPLGLHDMGGNVMEWVADCLGHAGSDGHCGVRLVRGGAFDKPDSALRTTARRGLPANNGYPAVGFRVVREG